MAAPPAHEPLVAVITTVGCPYCKKTKAALDAAGIPHREYELSEKLEVLSKVKAATGQATVPQVFVGGKLLGGASEVVPLVESGGLQQLLADAAAPPLPAELAEVLEQAAAARQAEEEAAEDPEAQRLRQLAADMRAAALGAARGAPFTARAAAAWLRDARGLSSDAAGAALGALQAAQLLTTADPAAADVALSAASVEQQPGLSLRLVADCPQPSRWKEPLNGQFTWFGPARPAAEVAESLRRRILALFDAHLVQGGRKVDYAALRADPAFADFAAAAAELQKVDLSQLSSREQRIAFFINTYNALVVHALAVFGPADGSLARLKWFDSVSYVIGGARWSSNDIEHGALRGNAPSPASLFALLGRPQWAGRTFKAGDPRAALAVTPVDPRIHFALNCGAASCPPIRVYTPDSLDFGLGEAARAFCAGEVAVDAEKRELELSMILKWYGPDFGTKEQLLSFLADHLPPGPQAELRDLMQRWGADGIALRFRPYDWTTNAVE